MVVVAMTLMSWFVLSNHCALGRMASSAQAQKEHACCHNDAPKPAQEPVDGKQGAQCCKSLRAVVPDGVKSTELTPPMVLIAVLAAVLTREVQTEGVAAAVGDTGPPRASSFSELVLHRSLRSHAPPFLA
jgi:hypothetical protein